MNSPTELEDRRNKTDPSLLQLIGIAVDLLDSVSDLAQAHDSTGDLRMKQE